MVEISKVIGLMSGTSLDGVDAALIETDGEDIARPLAGLTIPYSAETRAQLRAALDEARDVAEGASVPQAIREAERTLTEAHVAAVEALLQKAGLAADAVALIGFHGQTILHKPDQHWTWQIGDGALLARKTGIDVINDFRTADVKAGGQGAPLAAIYHQALLKRIGAAADTAVLNLGGVANITWWDGGETLIAFDTGPANAPSNDWVKQQGLGEMDQDGALAASGTVDEARLSELLEHAFLSAPYPKSLDRFSFTAEMAEGLSPANGAATLAAFTAAAVGKGLDLLPQRPTRLIVCGGGRKNPTIMKMLAERAKVTVVPAEEVGWRGDAIEAECFAFLAVRTLRGLPISFPSTTGVPEPMTGGVVMK
jgi:anhydro-N-acetylmuramic acid kinase